jgi:hypothetical protein
MGFLNKLFGRRKSYPELSENHPASSEIEGVKTQLVEITNEVNDHLEAVPNDNSCYIFIGNPQKNFGMAWISKGEIFNFQTLQEKGYGQKDFMKIYRDLKKAYRNSLGKERFCTQINGKEITVTPSTSLARELEAILPVG